MRHVTRKRKSCVGAYCQVRVNGKGTDATCFTAFITELGEISVQFFTTDTSWMSKT